MLRLLVDLSIRDDGGLDGAAGLPMEAMDFIGRQLERHFDGEGDGRDIEACRHALADTAAVISLLHTAQEALDTWAEALARGRDARLKMQAGARRSPVDGVDAAAETREMGFLERLGLAVDARIRDDGLNVDALAAAVGISRSTLSRRLRCANDMAPMDFIWDRRLRWAVGLLLANEDSVAEIAYASGFKTAAHFSRRFRAFAGCPPSAFVARQRIVDVTGPDWSRA